MQWRIFIVGPVLSECAGRASVAPMGWMDWEVYRCNINEEIIRNTTEAMVAGGWLQAGYDTVHIDDCWAEKERDAEGRLVPDASRFPSGIKALADWVHSRGMKLGLYSAAAPMTCAKFQPGSQGNEALDARTFQEWGVDYLKFDACQSDVDALAASYRAMGAALRNTSIVYACSWGAKGGSDADMVDAGCDLWRLWHDIEAKKGWSDVVRIAEHWADQADAWRNWSGPPSHGRGWHDPDQLLAGDEHLNSDESIAQLGLWSILSAPLILGNSFIPNQIDASVVAAYQNPEIIAVARDKLAVMGQRLGARSEGDEGHEIWARPLTDGALAVLLWNKATPNSCKWDVTQNVTAGNDPSRMVVIKKGHFEYTRFECCSNPSCESFTFTAPGGVAADVGVGTLYSDSEGVSWRTEVDVSRFIVKSRPEPSSFSADLSVDFSVLEEAGLWESSVAVVRDLLNREDLGMMKDKITAKAVPSHGISLLKLMPVTLV